MTMPLLCLANFGASAVITGIFGLSLHEIFHLLGGKAMLLHRVVVEQERAVKCKYFQELLVSNRPKKVTWSSPELI